MEREDTQPVKDSRARNIFFTSMISGACSGLFVELALFPLDTIKTRLQSQHGFMKSGGFKRVYQGILPVMIGSAPGHAAFFGTYESIKEFLQPKVPVEYHWMVHMGAAASADSLAALIRSPLEVIKQRKQALLGDKLSSFNLKLLYRGYISLVLRDLPFGVMQMPLWEHFKFRYKQYVDRDITPLEGAACGAAAVSVTASVTTPVDVIKTRIILASLHAGKNEVKIRSIIRQTYRDYGIGSFFAGYFPRLCTFTAGAFIYYGIYEHVKQTCQSVFPYDSSSRY